MNSTQKTSYRQIALIIGALAAGAGMTRVIPEVRPLAAYVQHTQIIPTAAVFKHASVEKASRDLTGFDVDFRRLALLGRIS